MSGEVKIWYQFQNYLPQAKHLNVQKSFFYSSAENFSLRDDRLGPYRKSFKNNKSFKNVQMTSFKRRTEFPQQTQFKIQLRHM